MTTPSTPSPTPAAPAAAPAPAASPAAASAPAPASPADTLFGSEGAEGNPVESPPPVDVPDAGGADEEGGGGEPPAPPLEPPPPPAAADYEFTVPEGFTLNETLEASARELFAENGVPKDKAQAFLDLYYNATRQTAEAANTAFAAQQAEWSSQIDAMPEFTGQTREKSLAAIGRLWDNYGTQEAKDALNMYGIGNHPALARFFAKIAMELDEGTPAPAHRPANVDRNGKARGQTAAEVLFPNP